MRFFLLYWLGAVSAFAQGPAFVPSGGASGQEKLVPAALGLRTDKQGNTWNIQEHGTLGRIGNSMVNSGLTLLINNQQFYSQQPMMTQDGKEFVLYGRQSSSFGGLFVTRRIRVVEKKGVLRYLEILFNPSSTDITATVELRTNFSGNYKSYVTDHGTPNANMLGKMESGILVTPSSSNQRQAYVFVLCSPKSQLKPALNSQNRYVISAHYQAQVPAGETVCLLHTVSQTSIPPGYDRKTLDKLFRPLALQYHLDTVPKNLRDDLANFSLGHESQGLALLSATSLDSLGVDRGRKDVLAVGESTRLIGSATCARLTIDSDFGKVDVPFENVAAVVGGNRGRRDRSKAFLRDGQVLGGRIDTEAFRFVLTSGTAMDLTIRKLDRLVCHVDEDQEKWPEDVVALLETHGGDRLALRKVPGAAIQLVTPWGGATIALEEIESLSPRDDVTVGHWVELKNGSRFYGFITGSALPIETPLFGRRELPVGDIRALVSREAVASEDDEDSPLMDWRAPRLTQPYVNLTGRQRLVGRVLEPKVTLLTAGEWVEAAPEAIRHLVNVAEETETNLEAVPPFRAELWGGGLVAGHLRERTLSVRVGEGSWRIPVDQIRDIVVPTPRVSDTTRKDIVEWVRQLGDEDWQTRERATEELAEFGFLAKPVLLDALNTTRDPEVRHRVEMLLGRLE